MLDLIADMHFHRYLRTLYEEGHSEGLEQ